VDPPHPLAELRGYFWGFLLSVKGPRLLSTKVTIVCIVTTHRSSIRLLYFEQGSDGSVRIEVFISTLPDAQLQGRGFGLAFTWDVLCSMVTMASGKRQPGAARQAQLQFVIC